MYITIPQNETRSLEVRVTDSKGQWVEELNILYKIIRVSDNAIIMSGIMDDIGQGVYRITVL